MEKFINSFELPEANQHFAEKIAALLDGFSSEIDGEISYTDPDENGFRRAINFFGKKEGVVTIDDVDNYQDRVEKKLLELEELSLFVQDNFQGAVRVLFEKSLIEYKNKFEMFTHAVRFEAEKGGYELTEDEYSYHFPKVQEYMTKIRGEPILSSKERVQGVYEDVSDAYYDNGSNLTEDQVLLLEDFLLGLKIDQKLDPYEAIEYAVAETLSKNQSEVFQRKIDANTRTRLFETYVKKEQYLNEKRGAIGGERYSVEQNPNKSNLSVNQQLEVIYTSADGLRELGDHVEKEGHEHSHVTTGKNSNEIFGNGFKGPGYLGTEEGKATFGQQITNGNVQIVEDLNTISKKSDEKTRAIVVCEKYGFDESVLLIEIFNDLGLYELGSVKKNPSARVLRTKRMGPLHVPYASSKDRVYLDGYNDVIEYLKKSKTVEEILQRFHTLNQFKVKIEDLGLIKQIKDELGVKESHLHKSHFISRRLRRNLQGLDDNNIEKGTLDELIYKINVDISDLLNIVEIN